MERKAAMLQQQLSQAEHDKQNMKIEMAIKGVDVSEGKSEVEMPPPATEDTVVTLLSSADAGTPEEQLARRKKYTELSDARIQQLKRSRACLNMLAAPDSMTDEFDRTHASAWQAPAGGIDGVTDDDVARLEELIDDFEPVVERLERRCDSDGLVIAIRHRCQQRGGWTPKDLVRQILAMKTSSGGRQDGKEFALDQLEGWLEMSQITYTPESLAFLVHQAGANIKQVQAGKKLQVTRFIYGLERVVTTPVVF